ncbi:MAG: Ig-like domain-containing protein, partial [Erysipelotrichaceae bacterium]|nr:Ig-like domain-containing protein [Erysipelotrichaceae bacterium]
MTSSDARRRRAGDPGFFVNTADSQPIVYDEEKGVVMISYDDLIRNQMGADEYRFTIEAPAYVAAYISAELDLPERCTVTFVPNNGEYSFKKSVWKGDAIEKPDAPVKDGYVFIGWYLEDEPFDFSTRIEENITLTAQWINGDVQSGENTIPDYTDEDKQEVAECVEDTSVDLMDAINSLMDELITDEVLQAMESEEVQALGEDVRLVVETSLALEIADVTLDEDGSVIDFVVDIVPQYRLKASNADGSETVTITDWTDLPEISENVTVRIYVPESMAAFANLWVMHKNSIIGGEHEVLHDENGYYIEFDNDEGFSPFKISTEKPAVPVVDSIELDHSSLNLLGGASEQLVATVLPEGVDDTVYWTSSDPEVASVDDTGLVTALKVGKATITAASALDESVSAFCEVRVMFTDVAESSKYFYDPVYWAFDNGITTGTSGTKFSPNDNCTRGQVVTFLWRAVGCPEPEGDNPF